MSRSEAEVLELELILAGKDEPEPEDVAKLNQQAMGALGMVGAVPPRKKAEG